MNAKEIMTVKIAKQLGTEHRQKGLKLTPFDCQSFDKILFALLKNDKTLGAKFYTKYRKAFNNAWQTEEIKQTFN